MCTTASKNAIVNTAMSESSGFLWIWMSLARLPIGADPGVSCKSSPDEPSQCAIVRQVLVVSKWYYVRSSRILIQQRMKVQRSALNAKFWWNVIDLKHFPLRRCCLTYWVSPAYFVYSIDSCFSNTSPQLELEDPQCQTFPPFQPTTIFVSHLFLIFMIITPTFQSILYSSPRSIPIHPVQGTSIIVSGILSAPEL